MHEPQPQPAVELVVEDPSTGERHTFSGATEEEANAAIDAFFGISEADEESEK